MSSSNEFIMKMTREERLAFFKAHNTRVVAQHKEDTPTKKTTEIKTTKEDNNDDQAGIQDLTSWYPVGATITNKMDVNASIEVIKGCNRSAEEKLHLRRLVRNGTISPATFAGTPNFADILEEFPVASVGPGVGSTELADAVAETVLAKLEEREKAKKDVTVVISSATQTKVDSLFKQVGLTVVLGDVPTAEVGVKFEAFPWGGRSEDDGLPDARTHIEEQLKKFGVSIGRGGYKIVDVHKNKQLLNVNDDKIGVISGGSDVAAVPFKTANASINKAVSVLWEIKTEENTIQFPDALLHFEPQGFVELLAARCLSDQPGVLVVITDLVSGAVLLQIAYNEQYKGFDVVEYETTLDQMGFMVAQFLSETAVPDASFRPVEAHQNPRDIPVIAFKKTKLSHDVGLALEQFNDMVDDTEPNSRERAYLVEQLFRSMDVPRMPAMVHHCMYV